MGGLPLLHTARRGGRLTRFAVAVAITLAASLALVADPAPQSRPEPAIERAAEAYLRALVNGDGAALTRLAPTRLENKYGPCPFATMPILYSPRVDVHRAWIMFRTQDRAPTPTREGRGAPTAEAPRQGCFALTMLDGVRGNPWRVRQVLYLNRGAVVRGIPRRSVTRKDVAQETHVATATRRYVSAWLKGDYPSMEALSYDWLPRAHRIGGMRLRSLDLRARPEADGETRIDFTIRVTVYKMLPKTIEGTLFAMREGDEWKIRGTELAL
jgi:hypothetical protein